MTPPPSWRLTDTDGALTRNAAGGWTAAHGGGLERAISAFTPPRGSGEARIALADVDALDAVGVWAAGALQDALNAAGGTATNAVGAGTARPAPAADVTAMLNALAPVQLPASDVSFRAPDLTVP